MCLACAVPVRGEVRCAECVHEELGDEVVAETPRPPRASPWAGGLYLAATALAMLPWDANGDRTGWFSALSPQPDPWPLIAAGLLGLAGLLALRGERPGRRRRAGHLAAGVLGVAAALIATPAPEFATRSPVPYVVLALGGLGLAAAVAALFRPRPDAPPVAP